jgi:large subunit ribosomal protein L22
MRLVADIVKGLPVDKALGILNFTPKIAAHHLAKTLKSAAANALSKEGTDTLSPEALRVRNITVNAAPTAKRIRFRSMGRVFRYRKRFCHLIVEVEGHTETGDQKKTTKASSKKAPAEDKKKTAKGTKKAKPTKAAAEKKASKPATKKPAKKKPATKKTAAKKTTKKATSTSKPKAAKKAEK